MNNLIFDIYIQNQTEQSQSQKHFSSTLVTYLLIFFIFIGTICIFLIVISILTKKHLYKNQLNILILSLQLNAIVSLILNCFFITFPYESLTSLQCNILFYACMLCVGSTLWHYVTITLNQYLINKQSKLSKCKCFTLISLLTPRLMSLLAFLPSIFKINLEYFAGNVKQIQSYSFIIIDFLIPWLLVTLLFISIFLMGYSQSKMYQVNHLSGDTARRLIEHHKRRNAFDDESTLNSMPNECHELRAPPNLGSRLQTRLKRREINMIKRFLSLIFLFVFGYLPFGVSLITYTDNSNFYDLLKNWFVSMTTISPILIIATNSKIYNQIKQFLIRFHRHFSKIFIKKQEEPSSGDFGKRVYFSTKKQHLELDKETKAERKKESAIKKNSIVRTKSIYIKRNFHNHNQKELIRKFNKS